MKTLVLLFFALFISSNIICQQKDWPSEETIGNTYYDLQTWRAMQNRIFYFDDGSIGAVWNMGMNLPNFNDMSIGYNYYDGKQ